MSVTPAPLPAFEWPIEDTRIPQLIFTDPVLHELEQERLFRGPLWHIVGHEAEIPNPGDFKTHELGGIPLIITRDRSGDVNVLINACSHRGCQVVPPGRGKSANGVLRCMYHQWTFDMNGRCTGASLPDSFPEEFDKEEYGLPRARCEIFRGAIFATLSDETPPLRPYLGDVAGGLEDMLGDEELEVLGYHVGMFDCNWKLIAENSHDGYHVVLLHGAYKMLKIRGTGEFRSPGDSAYYHSWAVFKPDEVDPEILHDPSVMNSKTRAGEKAAVINVFPINAFSMQMDSLMLRYYTPRGVDRTEVIFAHFAPKSDSAELREHRIRQSSTLWGPQGVIQQEDAAALARMQRAAGARGQNVILKGAPKRFPPYRLNDEAGIRDYYRSYRLAMGL